ncbi:MAG: diacylglycerol kinase family protein [Oscillospiraceae bacterium]|nr:diacylglycerol kinase family protein [Oscillospiraceae bacterium]
MNRSRSLIKSFVHAFRGIAFCVMYERNMRIHIVVTVYVMLTALYFYELTRTELILLILTCVSVMSLEIINTAIEVLTDKASPEYSALARAAKDAAAGAVLLSSIAAVVIGVILLWDLERLMQIIGFFSENLFALFTLLVSLVLAYIFVFNGKERRKRGIKRNDK